MPQRTQTANTTGTSPASTRGERHVPRHRPRTPSYELTGPPDAPLIIVLGGISASRHVTTTDVDPTPGWWDNLVGPNKALDTTQVQVLGIDYLDGGRAPDGRPARTITTHDQAEGITRVLNTVGVRRVAAMVGASYGGMVALALAEQYPERVERLVVISAPHEPHPMSTALRSLQRQIVKLGLESGRTTDGLALARALAMTTYRSAREFADRFESAPITLGESDATFAVERYLAEHGERFASRWAAERFLALSLSGDLHRVDPARIHTPAVIVAAEGDAIVPETQLQALLAGLSGPARLVHLASARGHDAFLTEPEALGAILADALTTTFDS